MAKKPVRPQGTKTAGEREYEVGMDEAWKTKVIELHSVFLANLKRTYDEYQQESLETIKHNRMHFDKLVSDAQSADNRTREIANQALQNAVETANMVGKQAVRHGDLSIDRQWNLEPSQGAAETTVLRAVTLDDAALKAIGATVAAAVANTLGGNSGGGSTTTGSPAVGRRTRKK